MLPFTHAQFLEVFARYNTNVWPIQIVAYLLGMGVVLAILRPSGTTGRWVGAGLAAMWLWTGIAYHGLHFSQINKAAYVFAGLFVMQALLLLLAGFTGTFRAPASRRPAPSRSSRAEPPQLFLFGALRKAAAWLGWGLISYAFVLYPLLGLLSGHRYPDMPMFGITPCPVTLFTFGVFLLTTAPVSGWLLVIPIIWSLIGGSAAFLLQVPQDWVLLFSGLSVLALLRSGAASKLKLQPQ
jgi:hypothetical protein